MKLTLKKHKGGKDLEKKLKKAGLLVSNYVNELLAKLEPRKKEEELEIAILTLAELGLPAGGNFEEIKSKAEEQGLDLCPPDVGPFLGLELKNQPNGEWLRIAMKPITDSDGVLRVFGVARDGDGLWLGTIWFWHGRVWNPDSRWVFVRSRKSDLTSLDSGTSGIYSLNERVKTLEKDMEKVKNLFK